MVLFLSSRQPVSSRTVKVLHLRCGLLPPTPFFTGSISAGLAGVWTWVIFFLLLRKYNILQKPSCVFLLLSLLKDFWYMLTGLQHKHFWKGLQSINTDDAVFLFVFALPWKIRESQNNLGWMRPPVTPPMQNRCPCHILLLVTTPSNRMILGWSNCPMMLASPRKSLLCFSV